MKESQPSIIKNILIIFVAVFLTTATYAQNPSSGIIVGLKAGTSKMLTEVTSDFKQHLSEFDQKGGIAVDLEVSKLLFNHFEIGTDINYTNLQWSSEDGDFTPVGKHHSLPITPNGPVEFHNRLLGQKFFVGYYISNFSKIQNSWIPEPFIRAGAGYIEYAAQLRYQEEPKGIIFAKGVSNYNEVNMSTKVFFGSIGLKTYVTPHFFINATYIMNYVPYDFLDAVTITIATEADQDLMEYIPNLRLVFFINQPEKKKNGTSKNNAGSNLPFSHWKHSR